MKTGLVLVGVTILLVGGVLIVLQIGVTIPISLAAQSQSPEESPGSFESRLDEQGAIAVEVTPLTLDTSGEVLTFEVRMNTHSVDLSMDLAALATLTTNTGVTVEATAWEASRGGHHVSGQLTFPGQADGASVLAGAIQITLVLRNVDAASRSLTWTLPSTPS